MQQRPNDWNSIRRHYAETTPLILAGRRDEWAVDPYDWDNGSGMIFMTPIEYWLWHDIRAVDLVLYPQYPVGRFFVDFANPLAKVAIECDGAAYHQDRKRDDARQAAIEAQGWTVYRIPGWMCRTEADPETGAPGEAAQFVRTIGERHRIIRGLEVADYSDDDWTSLSELAHQWLQKHARCVSKEL